MPAKRTLLIALLIAFIIAFIANCGGDVGEFQGTVVAPLETISALTPGPELFATLTAHAPANQALVQPRPATPTPRPATPTPRPATPTPRPPTPTPQPPTATPPPPTPTATPPPLTATPWPVTPISVAATPTTDPATYLGVVQQVGSLGEVWTLSDIRVGIHPQKIRVVWQMAENRDTAPSAEIVEVDNTKTAFPRRGGLRDPSWGQARIDVMIRDCYAYGMPLDEMLPIILPANSLVTKIGLHPTFDDALLGFSIGLSRPAAYELYTLTDPVRIVIDVITQP